MQSQDHAFLWVFVVRSELMHTISSKEQPWEESADTLHPLPLEQLAATNKPINMHYTQAFFSVVICERQVSK